MREERYIFVAHNCNKMDKIGEARKVTFIGLAVNILLTSGKFVAGVIGNSSAMVADAVHSLSDSVTDIIVLVFVSLSGRKYDKRHPYGHGKFETFASLLVAMALAAVGIGLLIDGVERICLVLKGGELEGPHMIALWAAVISILVKEVLYRYTVAVGRRISSSVVIANAWHHRSDAFSSVATALGIGGAIFLGESWRVLDPLVGVVVSLFIVKVAVDIALPVIRELLETSLPQQVEEEIVSVIMSDPAIINVHKLRTRKVGDSYAIDLHIVLGRDISFVEAHDIATRTERRLYERYGDNTYITLHMEPSRE